MRIVLGSSEAVDLTRWREKEVHVPAMDAAREHEAEIFGGVIEGWRDREFMVEKWVSGSPESESVFFLIFQFFTPQPWG